MGVLASIEWAGMVDSGSLSETSKTSELKESLGLPSLEPALTTVARLPEGLVIEGDLE